MDWRLEMATMSYHGDWRIGNGCLSAPLKRVFSHPRLFLELRQQPKDCDARAQVKKSKQGSLRNAGNAKH